MFSSLYQCRYYVPDPVLFSVGMMVLLFFYLALQSLKLTATSSLKDQRDCIYFITSAPVYGHPCIM